MTTKEAKDLDMVDYLSKLGFEPIKVTEPHYWYSSPLRDEKTPSFKINKKMNRWKDWGSGESGNLVDFGVLYHKCSVSDFLKLLDDSAPTISQHHSFKKNYNAKDEEKQKIKILSVKPIISLPLVKYLHTRRISMTIADQYLKEVSYELKDKNYYALGFQNNSGGYELRNQYIKAASAPKDSTFIDNGTKELAVFEGFFNFLSYQTLYHKKDIPIRNFLVLNSTSFFEKNIPRMHEHRRVHLYLDNDATGQKFTKTAIQMDKEKFIDERHLYQNYDDLNHWLSEIGLSHKQQIRQKP
ncbi:MAG TPA: toprim domain-containing protein [Niabella sp.]|nr:toprim domain-containing protein [Niabella sp.]HUN01224.1 toprim domain-containing protein [Niabella sp.]